MPLSDKIQEIRKEYMQYQYIQTQPLNSGNEPVYRYTRQAIFERKNMIRYKK